VVARGLGMGGGIENRWSTEDVWDNETLTLILVSANSIMVI